VFVLVTIVAGCVVSIAEIILNLLCCCVDQGDSAIGIVEKFQENVIIIHGSKFKDDSSDDYSYLLLSSIILHMEAGRCVNLYFSFFMSLVD